MGNVNEARQLATNGIRFSPSPSYLLHLHERNQMTKALTVDEAAQVINKSRRTIYNWIHWGALSYTSRYIDSDELFKAEALMNSRLGRPRKNPSNDAQGA